MASDGGMAEVHDRRPLVLVPDEARAWLDPAVLPQEAEEIALYHGLPAEAFEWYAVGHEVGNVRSEGAVLISPKRECAANSAYSQNPRECGNMAASSLHLLPQKRQSPGIRGFVLYRWRKRSPPTVFPPKATKTH